MTFKEFLNELSDRTAIDLVNKRIANTTIGTKADKTAAQGKLKKSMKAVGLRAGRWNVSKFEGNESVNEAHVVTHSPSTYEYYSHEAKEEPTKEGTFKYTDAEDRPKAKAKAEKHAAKMNNV